MVQVHSRPFVCKNSFAVSDTRVLPSKQPKGGLTVLCAEIMGIFGPHAVANALHCWLQCTQHGGDDYPKIIQGDPGLESIYNWTTAGPTVAFRGRTGKGDGVHVLTGEHLVLRTFRS